MSRREDDVIVVFQPTPGIFEALKEAYPNADIRNASLDSSEMRENASKRLFAKITPSELAVMKEADILVLSCHTLVQAMYDLPKLKWVQLLDTGLDTITYNMQKDKPRPSYVITRNIAKDIGLIMAEYVVGQVICHERSWYSSMQNQLQKTYDRGNKFALYRSLSQITIGLLGLGPMALEMAAALKHFGSRVHGFSRRAKGPNERSSLVDEFWHGDQLPSFLAECDYIVAVLPSTPETKGLLSGDVLKHAKRSPVFMNVGRGDLLSEEDILKALDAGWISQAILDVFEREPLPVDSALWTHPKVVITPHVAGFGNRVTSLMDCFSQNYPRYLEGKPLIGTFNWENGY
ncbi:glyoxylate/hydroxypyruvate reductase A-like isoform X1 [Palaemon carinicauda]|uniref:glyoxylate/hydroxypyruvate reductase A-like isoform X1 n=1 Tax=Palaemon carinicauda TaxID=392227 RepID=UPI0035B66859